MNIKRQNSLISNFLYIRVFAQVPWTSIYPSFTVTLNKKTLTIPWILKCCKPCERYKLNSSSDLSSGHRY